MTLLIDLGRAQTGAGAGIDLAELLATRLLVQGNSGSGKSHLLRRLLEQSAPHVQQVVIDPEGDFVTLADAHGHVVVDAAASEAELHRIAARVRRHRVSVVLNLEGLEVDGQMRAAASFLGGLFDQERDYWYPVLVVVDEAQLFAPAAAAGEVSDEARRLSLGAMTNLMCRGRKRGLAGVIATQRLAKLAKNVAAEASNFLMGRTFLDIDMQRAADLLGMDRRGAEMFRDLERGHFVALGPALSRRPLPIRIGSVATESRGGSPSLLPLPEPAADARDLLFAAPTPTEAPPRAQPRPKPVPAPDVLVQLAKYRPPQIAEGDETVLTGAEREAAIAAILAEVLADRDAGASHVATLYQDFTVRCRIRRLGGEALDLPAFRRRLAVARAGIADEAGANPAWDRAQALASELPDDLHGLFLLLAQAALQGAPTPSDDELARAYGTSSAGRARRMIGYLEERGAVVCRRDLRGAPVVAIPALGCETAPGEPEAGAKVRARR